jgi:hypothetical protein
MGCVESELLLRPYTPRVHIFYSVFLFSNGLTCSAVLDKIFHT